MILNEDKPLLSICIPTYNRAKYLDRLLAEILAPCEKLGIGVLVSDNGSTDNTQSILVKYKAYGNLLCFRNNRNEGFDFNVLTLLQHVSSRYIWLMGDDDVFDVGYLPGIIELINKYPDFGLMYLDHDLQDNNRPAALPIKKPIQYRIVDQQTYCDQVLHRATLMSANIINAKYFACNMIDPACVGKKWLHVHILLRLADKLVSVEKKNIIVGEKIFRQRTGTVDEKVFALWFIDYFLETVSLSKVTAVNLDVFMNKFYSLAVRGTLLEMGWRNSFAQSWQYFRRARDKFGISIYDTIIFIFTTSVYRLIGPKRLKYFKNLFILRQIMFFLRRNLIDKKTYQNKAMIADETGLFEATRR